MKQNINPSVVALIIGLVVVCVAVGAFWVWRAPSTSVENNMTKAEINAQMKASHSGPTADEQKQIQEWKKTHPGAYTKY